MKRFRHSLVLTLVLITILASPSAAQEDVVRAVLIYSPTCAHCHEVMTEDLPPLIERYNREVEWTYLPSDPTPEPDELPAVVGSFGNSFQLLYINGATEIGSALYYEAVDRFEIPEERRAVPMLIINETVLVGSVEIPEQFPQLIEQGLATGGTEWPDIPGLPEVIAQMVPMLVVEETPSSTETPTEPSLTQVPTEAQPTSTPKSTAVSPMLDFSGSEPSVLEKIQRDPVGNSLAIIVLVGIVGTFLLSMVRVFRSYPDHAPQQVSKLIPILTLAGIVVAGYLTFVERSGSEAFCGPVGDCNIVQGSKYAKLFGVIPVGLFGLLGYIFILAAWFLARRDLERISNWAVLALFGMATFGTLFSIYLTFLEPFVLGATCMWCLTSAILITALLWISVPPATAAMEQL
jgi:uncharacterized membrane protein